MTKEQASLQELGLSEAQLAERQAKVIAILHGKSGHPHDRGISEETYTAAMDELARATKGTRIITANTPFGVTKDGDVAGALAEGAIITGPIKPPKKKRSDAGVPRKKTEPPAPAMGKLTKDEADKARALYATVQTCTRRCYEADQALADAVRAANEHLASLTA